MIWKDTDFEIEEGPLNLGLAEFWFIDHYLYMN